MLIEVQHFHDRRRELGSLIKIHVLIEIYASWNFPSA